MRRMCLIALGCWIRRREKKVMLVVIMVNRITYQYYKRTNTVVVARASGQASVWEVEKVKIVAKVERHFSVEKIPNGQRDPSFPAGPSSFFRAIRQYGGNDDPFKHLSGRNAYLLTNTCPSPRNITKIR